MTFAVAFLLFLSGLDGGDTDASSVDVPDGGSVVDGGAVPMAPLGSSRGCASCHGTGATLTGPPALSADTYRGSMMSFAGEDPFFLAAWEIARGDDEEVALLCARCHFPGAVVAGRSFDAMLPVDREGIACDLCHRMAIPPPIDEDPLSGVGIGNADFAIGVHDVKIGPFGDAVTVGHLSVQSSLVDSSRMCGQCHDVSDGKRPRRMLDGTVTERPTPLERTFSEWRQSAFADPASPDFKTCQGCHMKKWTGRVAALGISLADREVASHRIVGSSVWAPLMVAEKSFRPDAPIYLRGVLENARSTSDDARRLLEEETVALSVLNVNDDDTMTVRVENLTGHKLPTGYSEGRRMWVASFARRDDGTCSVVTGAFDPETCELDTENPPRETWEMIPGVDGTTPTFHFALVDTILKDNRIPPRGFRPDVDTVPVGKEFPVLADGSLAPYDDVIIPLGARDGSVTVDVVIYFQATTKEFLTFLVEGAPIAGPELGTLFAKAGGGPILIKRLAVRIDDDGTMHDAEPSDECIPPVLDKPWRCLPPGYEPAVVAGPVVVDGGAETPPIVDEPSLGCQNVNGRGLASFASAVGPVLVALTFRRRRAHLTVK